MQITGNLINFPESGTVVLIDAIAAISKINAKASETSDEVLFYLQIIIAGGPPITIQSQDEGERDSDFNRILAALKAKTQIIDTTKHNIPPNLFRPFEKRG